MAWAYKNFTYDDFASEKYKTPEELEKFEYDAFEKGDDFTYDDYTESDTVKQAGEALNAHLANKPGEYQSQWQSQLDTLMNNIMNRDKFSYDLNGDALYQQYKDKYIQQGKLAMGDAIGQASAMTGGYGNSYAQSVGQQQYQASLDNLNDIVPQLYQMALDKYNQEGQDLYNQYGMVMDRENQDYGRYRDTVSDYLTDRDYLTGRYDSERDYDYSKYVDNRNFAYGQYADDLNFRYNQYSDDRNLAYSQFESDRAFDYQKYWDQLEFDYNKYSADRALAYDKYATDKNLSYEEYRNAIADKQWEKEYEESVRQYNEQMAFQKQQYDESTVSNASKDYYETGGKIGYDNGSLSPEQVAEMQTALGISADGKWGSGSTEAAGGLTADQAWKAYQSGKLGKVNVSYEEIEGDLNYFISQGASKSEINSYLREALNNGYISTAEYNKLKELYAPRGQVYGTTTGGGGGLGGGVAHVKN